MTDNNQPPHKPLRLADILAQQQKEAAAKAANTVAVPTVASIAAEQSQHLSLVGNVAWNVQQQEAVTRATRYQSFCLIGAAGTGKTTTLKGIVQTLLVNHQIPPLTSSSKYLSAGSPGILLVSYTRRAVRQIARQFGKHFLAAHCLTAHRVLEFEPVFYEYETSEGELKKTMRFEPMRHRGNPLPNVKFCVVDESSMFSVALFQQLKDALPADCVFIFLGDLHQLPPVYGESVLVDKLQELPVVELTEVYRQALDSPVIKLATDLKDGKEIPVTAKIKWSSPDGKSNVVINPLTKQLDKEDAMDMFCATAANLVNSGNFNEEEDVILMPHNVNAGTIETNLHIANALAVKRGAVVHHVIAGYQHWYLAIGDRLLVDKQDCVIRDIIKNPKYIGKPVMEPAVSLDRWGTYQDKQTHHYLEESNEDIDDILDKMAEQGVDDKVNEASHVLVLESLDYGNEWRVSQVGTFNGMVFSYALTVHKSQGSEWRRVFLFLCKHHHAMCSRELVYTAVTRAREDLIIICEPDRRDSRGTLTKAATSPRIKGNTLAEKLEWLKEQSKEKLGRNEEGGK